MTVQTSERLQHIQWESGFGKGAQKAFRSLSVLFIIGVMILGSGCDGKTTERVEKAEADLSAADVEIVRTTDMATMGMFFNDYTYGIRTLWTSKSLDNGKAAAEAGEGIIFAIVLWHFGGVNGEQPTSGRTDDLLLKDSHGRIYRQSSAAKKAMFSNGFDTDYTRDEIELEAETAGNAATVFAVPEDSLKEPLEILLPKKGAEESNEVVAVPVKPEDFEDEAPF